MAANPKRHVIIAPARVQVNKPITGRTFRQLRNNGIAVMERPIPMDMVVLTGTTADTTYTQLDSRKFYVPDWMTHLLLLYAATRNLIAGGPPPLNQGSNGTGLRFKIGAGPFAEAALISNNSTQRIQQGPATIEVWEEVGPFDVWGNGGGSQGPILIEVDTSERGTEVDFIVEYFHIQQTLFPNLVHVRFMLAYGCQINGEVPQAKLPTSF